MLHVFFEEMRKTDWQEQVNVDSKAEFKGEFHPEVFIHFDAAWNGLSSIIPNSFSIISISIMFSMDASLRLYFVEQRNCKELQIEFAVYVKFKARQGYE